MVKGNSFAFTLRFFYGCLGFYFCDRTDKEAGGCGMVISTASNLDIAYRGSVSVMVAITRPMKLAMWPGGCSD